ncbi:MAG: hypothetical protein QOE92_744, partial [Chloroflexota bacterium]|nr:hypothetical protein [Chloroflexota bacterium]
GRAARARVHAHLGPAAAAARWAETWPRLVAAAGGGTDPPPSTHPETPTAAAIEPEAPAAYLDTPSPPAETTGPRLGGEAVVETAFTPRYPNLCRLDVHTSTFGAATTTPLEVALLDGGGTILREATIAPADVADDAWTAWELDPLPQSAGRRLRLRLGQPGAPAGQGAAVWTSLSAPAGAGVCVRLWSRPTRAEVADVAMSLAPGAGARAARATSPLRVLWHKGLHSLRSQGPGMTAARAYRYARRWLRAQRPR